MIIMKTAITVQYEDYVISKCSFKFISKNSSCIQKHFKISFLMKIGSNVHKKMSITNDAR